MRLTKFSDYSLRVLMLAASRGGGLVTIEAAAAIYGISQAHLKKVVRVLSRAGFLRGVKGRAGGFALARPPEEINLGDVLRTTESDFAAFECLQPGAHCVIDGPCRLRRVGQRAADAFLAVFDSMTLADVALPAGSFPPAPA